jgi:hypothetical protein
MFASCSVAINTVGASQLSCVKNYKYSLTESMFKPAFYSLLWQDIPPPG